MLTENDESLVFSYSILTSQKSKLLDLLSPKGDSAMDELIEACRTAGWEDAADFLLAEISKEVC